MHIQTCHVQGALKPTMEWGSEVHCYRTGYTVKIQRMFILYNDGLLQENFLKNRVLVKSGFLVPTWGNSLRCVYDFQSIYKKWPKLCFTYVYEMSKIYFTYVAKMVLSAWGIFKFGLHFVFKFNKTLMLLSLFWFTF